MKDKEIEDLLRKTWQPKPPPQLKQRALAAPQAARQDRSHLRRFASKACVALAATAAAAGIAMVLIHPSAPGRSTRTASAPPARMIKRFSSPIAKTLPDAQSHAVRAKQTQIAAAKTLSHKPKRQIAFQHDAAEGARVSYVDADRFGAAHATNEGYETGKPAPAVEPDEFRTQRSAYAQSPQANLSRLPDGFRARTARPTEDIR